MSCKDLIEEVLAAHPETRKDNRVLLFRVWERQGLDLTDAQWAVIRRLQQPETIRRTRAKLQNEQGKYRPEG